MPRVLTPRALTEATSLQDRWLDEIDSVVARVFQTMLLRSCDAAAAIAAVPPGISARIQLSGAVQALCVVEFPFLTAEKLTDAFLGSEDGDWDDHMIDDAVGELCNMIAGGWKGKLGTLDPACQLSTPSISRAGARTTPPGDATLRRTYTFEGSTFQVTLVLK
jgi:chemotaxis protein CheX